MVEGELNVVGDSIMIERRDDLLGDKERDFFVYDSSRDLFGV